MRKSGLHRFECTSQGCRKVEERNERSHDRASRQLAVRDEVRHRSSSSASSPRRKASATASVRLRAPITATRFVRPASTSCSLIPRRPAISRVSFPFAINWSTARSRGVIRSTKALSSISQRYVTGDHVVLSTRVAGPSGIGDLEAEQTQAVRVDDQVDSDIGHIPWLPSSLALTSKAREM